MKILINVFLTIMLCIPTLVFAQQDVSQYPVISTVVIDPGHGGKDSGCVHGNIYEKDINLAVAKLFGEMIRESYPDVNVIFTRTKDVAVGLAERGNIANKANADLFISIHSDAMKNNSRSNGNSTFVMGMDKESKNLEVAQRENSVIVYEDDYETKYEGYDPSSTESFIIFSLMQNANSEQSMVFAELLQKHYKKNTPIVDRGARQAPYLVLWRTAMPSVLTELGFVTNVKDRAFITSKKGQKQLAIALFEAFSEYKTLCEKRAQGVVSKKAKAERVVEVAPATTVTRPATKPVKTTTAKPATKPAVTTAKPKAQPKSTPQVESNGVKYYVQLCVLSIKSDPFDAKFGSYRGKIVQKRTDKGLYRCLVPATSRSNAIKMSNIAKREFEGAFVIAFKGDKIVN